MALNSRVTTKKMMKSWPWLPLKRSCAPAMAEELSRNLRVKVKTIRMKSSVGEHERGIPWSLKGVEMMDMKQIRAIVRDELRELLDEVKAERRQAAEERKADMERVRKANETLAANLKRDVTNAIATLLQQHSKENAKTLKTVLDVLNLRPLRARKLL